MNNIKSEYLQKVIFMRDQFEEICNTIYNLDKKVYFKTKLFEPRKSIKKVCNILIQNYYSNQIFMEDYYELEKIFTNLMEDILSIINSMKEKI